MEKKYNNRNNNYSDDDKNKRMRRPAKKKVCLYCTEKVGHIDYKDVARLKKFVTEKGKIIPRRTSGICAHHQRELAVAIKRARHMALMPFKAE